MNILLIGHRQHGKTDVGHLLAKVLNTTAHDSSRFMCERVIFPALKDKYGYATPQECYDDRGNHRQEWFEMIEAYNDEPDRLTRAILAEGSIYVGMRSRMEFAGSNQHFDFIVWVDASKRVPEEPSTSMKLTKEDADYVLDNNGPFENLPHEIAKLVTWMHETEGNDRMKATYDLDVAHHLARGTLDQAVLRAMLSGQEDELVRRLSELTPNL